MIEERRQSLLVQARHLLHSEEWADCEPGDCAVCDNGDFHDEWAPRSGATWEEMRAMLDGLTDPRIGLMAEVAIWPIAMEAAGAPIEWMAMEQSSNLPETVLEDLSAEFTGADWACTNWETMDAVDYGVASRRKRVFMIATRARYAALNATPVEPIPATTLAEALGWPTGERVNTRGNRPIDPVTGRTKGSTGFTADRPAQCLTGKARTWYRESDGRRFTTDEAGLLVGFRTTYPWQGSRTSAFQQAADVVSPVMSAAVMGSVLGRVWEPQVRDYLTGLYHLDDDYALTERFPTCLPGGTVGVRK